MLKFFKDNYKKDIFDSNNVIFNFWNYMFMFVSLFIEIVKLLI